MELPVVFMCLEINCVFLRQMQTFIAFQSRDRKNAQGDFQTQGRLLQTWEGSCPPTLSPTEVSFREDLGLSRAVSDLHRRLRIADDRVRFRVLTV